MHIAVLMTNTDESEFAQARADNAYAYRKGCLSWGKFTGVCLAAYLLC